MTEREFYPALLRSPAGRGVGWFLVVIVLFVYTQWQLMPLLDDRGTGVIAFAAPSNDYKHFYLGSKLLLDGISPYEQSVLIPVAGDYAFTVDPRFRTINPYVYLPFTGIAMAPLSAIPFAQSVLVFLILNHILLFVAALGAMYCVGWRGSPWPVLLFLLIVATNFSLYRQNSAGQLNLILLAGYTVILAMHQRRISPVALGALAAALTLFKLSPGILLFWFVARKMWVAAISTIAFSILLMIGSVAIVGLQPHIDFFKMMPDLGFGRSSWPDEPANNTFWRDSFNLSPNAFFHRMFVEDPRGVLQPIIALPHWVANAMTWVVALTMLGAFCFASYVDRSPKARASFALAIASSILLPSLMWDHYLIQLVVPVILLWPSASITKKSLLAASIIMTGLRIPLEGEIMESGLAIALMSSKTLPALAIWGVALSECLRGWGIFEEPNEKLARIDTESVPKQSS